MLNKVTTFLTGLLLAGTALAGALPGAERSSKVSFVKGAANPAVAEIYTAQTVADVGGALGGKYFSIHAGADNALYTVWIDVANGNTAPVIANDVLVEVDIASGATAAQVATAIQAAIDPLAPFVATVLSDTVTITNADKGSVTDIAAGTSGFTVGVSTQGVSSSALIADADIKSDNNSWKICNDAVQTSTYIFVGEGVDTSLTGVQLGKGKCYVCPNCPGSLLKNLKVSSQAASASYAVVQYRK